MVCIICSSYYYDILPLKGKSLPIELGIILTQSKSISLGIPPNFLRKVLIRSPSKICSRGP